MCLIPTVKLVIVCVPVNAHTFFLQKIEQAVNPTLSTLCMSTVGLCLIAFPRLIVAVLKVLV